MIKRKVERKKIKCQQKKLTWQQIILNGLKCYPFVVFVAVGVVVVDVAVIVVDEGVVGVVAVYCCPLNAFGFYDFLLIFKIF